jgi:hypothetical protein
MDAQIGVPSGTRSVFTYGPLGFLTVPYRLYYRWETILAILFALALAALVFGLIIHSVRRLTSLPVAVFVALVAGGAAVVIWRGTEPLIGIGFFLAAEIIRRDPDSRAGDGWWFGLGLLIGIGSLAKASVAIDLAIMTVLVIIASPRESKGRTVAILAVTAVASFSLGWFSTGNGFGNLIAYIRGALSVADGYSPAMYSRAFDDPTYEFVLFAISAAGLVALAWATHPRIEFPPVAKGRWQTGLALLPTVAVGLALAVTLWVLFKDSVVKQGFRVYFITLPLLIAALAARPVERLRRWIDGTGITMAVLAAAMVSYLVTGPVPAQLVSPISDAAHLKTELHVLLSAGRSHQLLAQERAGLQAHYAVPAEMLAMMAGHTVDIDPWEQEVAYAYPQLKWDSLPVLQDYSAYTTYLDDLDRNYLMSDQAPQFILKQPQVDIDFRVPWFDPPSTQTAIECRYRQVVASTSWDLLERVPNRCAQPQLISTVHTGFRQVIVVPRAPADSAVVASVSLAVGPGWKLLNLLFRPPAIRIYLNGSSSAFRYLYETSSGLHLLRPAANLGYDPRWTPGTTNSLSFGVQGQGSSRSGVTVRFYAVPFD